MANEPNIPGGFILLARKILDNPIFNKPELLQLYVYCLEKANHKPDTIIFNNEEIKIERGQFVSGRHIIAKDLKQKPDTTYKRLKLLEKLEYLNIKSNNKFSLITCTKYEYYQNPDNYKSQPSNNKITTREQPDNTNNNDNNDNNHVCVHDKYTNSISIEYSDIVNQLINWNVPDVEELLKKHTFEKIQNCILQVKEKKPRSNAGYFFYLIDNFEKIEKPAQLNKVSIINRAEANDIMTDIIFAGRFDLKLKLENILKTDNLEEFNKLKEELKKIG